MAFIVQFAMSQLFEPVRIGSVTVSNRIAKSAMVEGLADERGRARPALAEMYERWSAGGVGLMFTGMMTVLPGWSLTPTEVGLYDDEHVEPLRAVTAAVHRHPGKIFFQLCHAPPQLFRTKAQRLGGVAPSAGFNRATLSFDRELSDGQIREIITGFASAARRAREAGADGVQIHGAHGYSVARMISPKHNRRRDDWGGPEGRLRFVEELHVAMRRAVGTDFPIAIKLNAHDGEPGGLTVDESLRIAQRLEARGIDAVEISAGTADVGMSFYPMRGGIPIDLAKEFLRREFPLLRPTLPLLGPVLRQVARQVAFEREAYFWPEARRFAERLQVPVICVGGIRSRAMATRVLEQSPVAMVSLARPLVREPSLPRRWQREEQSVATCASCSRCYLRIGLGESLRCDRGLAA